MKHNSYLVLALSTVIMSNCFANDMGNQVVDSAPKGGKATLDNGMQCRYSVSRDQHNHPLYIDFDCKDEMIHAQYLSHMTQPPLSATIMVRGPKDATGSFNYVDNNGVKRICYYKMLHTMPKSSMYRE